MRARRPLRTALATLLASCLLAATPVGATESRTWRVVDVVDPGTGSSLAMWLSGTLGDYHYTWANDGTHGFELWRTNGDDAGTTLVMDICPGVNDSNPAEFTAMGDWLYFAADDCVHGRELWRTNGVTTEMVLDIYSGADSSSPTWLVAVNDRLYFAAADADYGRELWSSDGTTAAAPNGTRIAEDINPGAGSGNPSHMTNLNGLLFFNADNGSDGAELWYRNGLETGTLNLNPGADSSDPLGDALAIDDWLYFTATDADHGLELWRVGPTPPELVVDIVPGVNTSSPGNFVEFQNTLYFSAESDAEGRELWRISTSTGDAELVHNINVGASSSSPSEFTVLGDYLYLRAQDATAGIELLRTDGTALELFDLLPGSDGGGPVGLITVGDALFFLAPTPEFGRYQPARLTAGVPGGPDPLIEDMTIPGTSAEGGCMCEQLFSRLGGRVFMPMYNSEVGSEFAVFDEPTYVLPETNRESGARHAWTVALSLLAVLTLTAGAMLRVRRT